MSEMNLAGIHLKSRWAEQQIRESWTRPTADKHPNPMKTSAWPHGSLGLQATAS